MKVSDRSCKKLIKIITDVTEVEVAGREVHGRLLTLDVEFDLAIDVVRPGRHFKREKIGRWFQVARVQDGLIVVLDYEKFQTFALSLQFFYFGQLNCFSGRDFAVLSLGLVFGRSFLDNLFLFL